MKRSKDFATEDLIQFSEQILEDVSAIETIADTSPDQAEETISSAIRERFIASIEESVETDGYLELTISEDEMRVEASFYPPSEGRKPIDLYEVEHLLQSKGIVYGIDWDAIKQAIHSCNTDWAPITDVLIASGATPVNEVSEHLEIEEKLLQTAKNIDLDSIRVDFKQRSPFVLVKKGEVLAHRFQRREGIQGSTVLGKVIPYSEEKVVTIEPGKHSEWEEDCVVAGCDGRFEYNNRSFWVNEVLQIESDIDYRTGNIDFPGDVLISGQIKDGFSVKSGGSVFCNTTMDASEVISEKDLIVRMGLIGRKKGAVKVGGSIRAKFIENCYVEAKDSITVDVCILNSAVHSGNKVELKEKGLIIGGTIHAQNGVVATQLGTEMGPKTEIYCGTNYSVEQKLQWIRDKSVQLAFKLKQVERKLQNDPLEKKKLADIQQKLRRALHTLNEASSSLLFKLDRNEKAEIVVRDRVFPGVYIEICHVSYIVSHSMRNVSFNLDKKMGKIVTEPLSLRTRGV